MQQIARHPYITSSAPLLIDTVAGDRLTLDAPFFRSIAAWDSSAVVAAFLSAMLSEMVMLAGSFFSVMASATSIVAGAFFNSILSGVTVIVTVSAVTTMPVLSITI